MEIAFLIKKKKEKKTKSKSYIPLKIVTCNRCFLNCSQHPHKKSTKHQTVVEIKEKPSCNASHSKVIQKLVCTDTSCNASHSKVIQKLVCTDTSCTPSTQCFSTADIKLAVNDKQTATECSQVARTPTRTHAHHQLNCSAQQT